MSLWLFCWLAALCCCRAAAGDGMFGSCTANRFPGLAAIILLSCSSLCFVGSVLNCAFVIFCLLCRVESSGDSATFLGTSRPLSCYALFAAAIWSQRGPAVGQQRRRDPICCCGVTRTPPTPGAPYKVRVETEKVVRAKKEIEFGDCYCGGHSYAHPPTTI